MQSKRFWGSFVFIVTVLSCSSPLSPSSLPSSLGSLSASLWAPSFHIFASAATPVSGKTTTTEALLSPCFESGYVTRQGFVTLSYSAPCVHAVDTVYSPNSVYKPHMSVLERDLSKVAGPYTVFEHVSNVAIVPVSQTTSRIVVQAQIASNQTAWAADHADVVRFDLSRSGFEIERLLSDEIDPSRVISYRASVALEGAHRDLKVAISSAPNVNLCNSRVVLEYFLDERLFLDQYQIEEIVRFHQQQQQQQIQNGIDLLHNLDTTTTTAAAASRTRANQNGNDHADSSTTELFTVEFVSGLMDVERPSLISPSHVFRLAFLPMMTAGGAEAKVCTERTVTIPFHQRYQEPSATQKFREAVIAAPKLVELFTDGISKSNAVLYVIDKQPVQMLVPVGQKTHYNIVAWFTTIFTITGAVTLVAAILFLQPAKRSKHE
eukprot:ANDGO_03881.mRNA.1 hypothetical protein